MYLRSPKLTENQKLKNFKIKSSMADGGYLENRKITISQKPFGRFWWNFAWWHILILQRLPANQKLKLLKIQDGGRPTFWKLLNAISQQLFDRFCWNLVRWCTLGHPIWRSTKISKFQNPSWRTAAILKISSKPSGQFCWNFVWSHILVLQSLPAVQKKLNFQKSKMAEGHHFDNC